MRFLRMHLLAATTLLLVMETLAAPVSAQDYSFGVPLVEMQVFVNPDASVRIVYDFTFRNNPGAHAIDVVDIGTPTARYDPKNVQARSGGHSLREIRKSTEVSPGFEVHMGPATIPAGREGKLHVEFTMPDMVFQDTTRGDYASLRVTPTWFGDRYVTGNTHLKVAIHLPKGVKPDEALHQGLNFTQKAVSDGQTSVVWEWPAVRFTGEHMVAVSFPKRDMQRVVRLTKWDLLVNWFTESTQARVIAGIVGLVLLGVAFFRFTGGTGIVVYLLLCGLAVWLFFVSPGWHLVLLPILVVLVAVNEWALRRRSSGYMPPIAEVEGGGIKRGLTAPEAAVLLEMPLARVLGLVIFGMLKKGILHQVSADPLHVAVDDAFRTKDGAAAGAKEPERFLRQAAQEKGIVMHTYEQPFLFLLAGNPGKPVKALDFSAAVRQLIQRVVARMKGFDLSDTKDYYQSIVRRACQQAAAIGDIPQREKTIDRDFEWILMGDDWPTVFTYGRPYRPIWTRGTTGAFPTWTGGETVTGGGIPGKTSASDVAASFTGWTENTFGNMASAISPGALSVPKPAGGFVDLGGADRLTGEFFQALSEAGSKGGGGGGGSGCACACAGCACACACAGGGR
jgi:hypothetical protein